MEQRSTANSKQGAIDLSSEFPLGRSLIDAGSEMLPAYFFFFLFFSFLFFSFLFFSFLFFSFLFFSFLFFSFVLFCFVLFHICMNYLGAALEAHAQG